ncbi:reverse transcriptase [Plakobranchus ocellatus]|uniref:Reverse transcriptase n=1 Tax=Plakobranchus ocellatus TaxID=259542 RepID=A0AAV4BS78_9GAST|nr:reverse transcriptase [Plakobranchus ocellatus]
MTEIHGNNSSPTTAGASDVDSNCTTITATTATTSTRRKVRTAKELIHEFTHSTSMHGVQYVMGRRPVWRRMVWSVLVASSVAWAAHNVYHIVSDYNSHSFQTSVSSEYQSKMNFPAVTVCNLNRIRLSKTTQFLLELLQRAVMRGIDGAVINYYFIDHFLKQSSRQQQREMGHQMQDMLVKCNFGNEVCTSENFTYSYNLQHGNCYTFAGSQDSKRSEWLTMRAGPGNGLSMEFNVQFDEYLPSTTASGLKVLIHDNGEVPFPEDGGIMAGTGAATSIAIRKVGGTVNNKAALRYCSTLDRLKEAIRRKRPGLLRRGVVLQHDNATPHSANLTQQWLQRYGWEILPHPAHSPDLAPSDFHLFGPLKRHLGGMAFETEDDLISELRNWFDNLYVDFFPVGINSLLSRWQKCIHLHGDYVEK